MIFYNVKDYGALGDGSTDDTAAFNSAQAAATTTGGAVYAPHGIYILNATNLNTITASMLGESMNGTILKLVSSFAATQNLIRIVSVSDIWIKNFTIDGNSSNVSSGTQYGLYLSTTTNCGVENILTQNWTGVGTHFYNNNRAFATNCYSTANTYHGFEFEQNTNGTFTGIHGYSNTLQGVLVSPGEVSGTGSKGNTFTNIQCDGNSQYGLAFNAANGDVSAFLSEGDVFTNVSLTNNAQYGLNIYKQNKQTFNNLYIYNNGYFGIYLFESANNIFSNIFLHNNSQATNGGYEEIFLEGYSTDSAHPSSNNVFSGGQIIIDGTNKASYGIAEGTANDGSNTYTNINIPNAGTAGRYNVLATTSAIISGATGFAVASNAALPGNQMGLDAPFGTAALRLYNPNSGGNFQFVTPNGTSEFWVGGNEVADFINEGIKINTGFKLTIGTGSNASIGTGTLSAGTATISTTAVTASSLVFLTDTSNGANIGTLSVGTITAGTSFVVNSSNALDASTFNWWIVN